MATTPSSNNSTTTEMDEFIKKSRVTRAAPPKPAYDPLQFVQIKPAKLYDLNKAKPSTERKLELKTQREVVVEDAEEWQCNLDNWKSSRRKRVEHIIDKITEAKKIEQEEVCRGRKKSKTFSEMLENSGSRRRFILPGAEDDEDAGSFSDDPQDGRDAGKEQYKDDSTDERATDDTSSCCSSKQTDGGSKTPELIIESPEVPEMNEFSLAIENYKSKFSLSSRTSILSGSPAVTGKVSNETTDIVPGTIESNMVYNETTNIDKLSVRAEELAPQDHVGGPLHGEETAGSDSVEEQREPEETPKVNVIERRRLFEQLQLQQMSCAQDTVAPTTKPFISSTVSAGNGHEERYETQSSTSDEPAPNGSSSEWLATGGSIKERRAIFERYRSSEANDELQSEAVGRSRSNSGAVTTVVKSRSESNVGASAKALVAAATASAAGLHGGKERYELTLEHLKRNNGGDCYEDSGIQSTDLSRSSVVSQADDNEMLSHLLAEVGKSPVRSVTTLDSASEFSDTECGNGQLLENALDVAFEEMDSELNEYDALVDDDAFLPATGDQHPSPKDVTAADRQLTECLIPPLTVVSLPTDYAEDPVAEFNDDLILLSSLPKSKLTPPKEKPPPPPVDDEPEIEPPRHSTAGTVASWVQKNALAAAVHSNGDDKNHLDHSVTNGNGKNTTLYEQHQNGDKSVGREDYRQLSSDEQWRSLESYEVVQQVQRQQSKKQAELLTEKDHQQDQEQQELLVYSNRIETQPSVHHHPLYDARDHEEIVSVERELLQIEQEELQRRREKQIFYEKLTKTDSSRLSEPQPQQQQQPPQQHQPQREQQPYYNTHHHQHLPHHHHHNHHNHHHRASMPAIDSRSLQNVNAYASFETPFLDDVGSYEMGSLHRESMPNLSQVAASSSHPSSLSSYGEEYSTNSGASFDGGWPTVTDRHPVPDRRPVVAPRPMLNGFPEHHHHRHTMASHAGGGGFQVPGGDRTRLYSNMLEQHPKDNKQNAYQPTLATVNRGQGGNAGNSNSTTTTLYGQHWLVQEAEQRRIEQHQKNNAKRPLPKFVIDAITQRVQKLNAGSSEHSDNLSEDSDLAMINSMKHHHHHQHHNQPQPLPPHHHHQPPPPVLPPASQQQQQYSNTTDKVLSVSGKKECSHCRIELGKGAAMAIESLGLFYHIECFKCCVCHVKLGDGTNGIDVRVRKYRLHCQNCFSSEDGVKFSCV
ncbi:uncharacterized protein LOC131212857 isoform X1 [Anopheles bellator]|uniref:uncharacterized protein LOC131212857 isoform X1 n=1 Tax=Anopheles bellator TaxID=139047 RepID=UPI0026485486|nr:uncharacterized protein LOC131212857 isoform X1 [Anopheles bellator]